METLPMVNSLIYIFLRKTWKPVRDNLLIYAKHMLVIVVDANVVLMKLLLAHWLH